MWELRYDFAFSQAVRLMTHRGRVGGSRGSLLLSSPALPPPPRGSASIVFTAAAERCAASPLRTAQPKEAAQQQTMKLTEVSTNSQDSFPLNHTHTQECVLYPVVLLLLASYW